MRWTAASVAIVGLCACVTQPRQQIRMALADQSGAQIHAYACAETCNAEFSVGLGALYECVATCPGVQVSESETCSPGDATAYAICYADPNEEEITPLARDRAARLAIGVLRGLTLAEGALLSESAFASRTPM